jgi:D-glycero-alpha-D-manno-heptose 1-phosphate guanylyltransferase
MIDALVLAGGFGTRLAATVPGVPKPMAPVCGRPFLELLLGALRAKGLRRAVLSLGYRAEMITTHFGPRFGELELAYEIETTPLGTGGAIRRGLARCQGDAALVVNGDTLLDLELTALCQRWADTRRTMLVACEVPDTTRYGRLDVADGRLVGFTEKGTPGPGWINSGHYVLPRHLLADPTLPGAFSFEADFLTPRLAQLDVAVFSSQGAFIDIGIPEDYARAQTELARWAI